MSVPAEAPNLLDVILDAAPDLRRSERKVADAVLRDPASVLHTGMAGLAAAAGVSEPTVMRFCNAVGCSGFQAFKLRLAQTLALGIPVTQSAVDVDDTPADLVEKLFDHSISSLDRTRRSLDRAAVAAAIDLLAQADELIFVGFGASGIVAQDAQQRFPMFGVPCQAPVDAHQQFMAAVLAGPRTVTVAISHTGQTAETLRAARAAKQAGGSVVALTGQPGPLSELADVALLVRTFEDTDAYTPTVSRLAGLVVIDVLATGVLLRHGPPALARLNTMKEQLATMRSSPHP
jgi:DNA-binding MurR/RpiR family transcriptional regulator